jgi:hypothetical protein
MSERDPSKCAVHEERLLTIEARLGRIEDDMDSLISEQHHRATDAALAAQAIELFRSTLIRLEAQIEAIVKDRSRIVAGLLANGAIGATSIAILLWALEHVQ